MVLFHNINNNNKNGIYVIFSITVLIYTLKWKENNIRNEMVR